MSENQEHKTWMMIKKAAPKIIECIGNPWGDNTWQIVESYVTDNDAHCNMKCVTPQGTWHAEVVSTSYSKSERPATGLFDGSTANRLYADSGGNAYMTVVLTPPKKQYIKLVSASISGDYANGDYYIDVYAYDNNDVQTRLSSTFHGKSSTTNKRVTYNRTLKYAQDIYASKLKFHMYISNGGWGNFYVNEITINNCFIKR